MFVEDLSNTFSTVYIPTSANVPSVTTEKAGVQYVLFNSFLNKRSYLTGFSMLASQSGMVQLNVNSCFLNLFNSV